jgi:hypothetical protein
VDLPASFAGFELSCGTLVASPEAFVPPETSALTGGVTEPVERGGFAPPVEFAEVESVFTPIATGNCDAKGAVSKGAPTAMVPGSEPPPCAVVERPASGVKVVEAVVVPEVVVVVVVVVGEVAIVVALAGFTTLVGELAVVVVVAEEGRPVLGLTTLLAWLPTPRGEAFPPCTAGAPVEAPPEDTAWDADAAEEAESGHGGQPISPGEAPAAGAPWGPELVLLGAKVPDRFPRSSPGLKFCPCAAGDSKTFSVLIRIVRKRPRQTINLGLL